MYHSYQDEFRQSFESVHVDSHGFYNQIMDCESIKQIILSFRWHLSVIPRHLESNESAFEDGFMVSIQIRPWKPK